MPRKLLLTLMLLSVSSAWSQQRPAPAPEQKPVPQQSARPEPSVQVQQPVTEPKKSSIDPQWANVGVTCVYVLIALFTLFAINTQGKWMKEQTGRISRQADLMNRQTIIALEVAKATRKAADAALEQIRAMKEKERARIQVEILDLEWEDRLNSLALQNVSWKLTLHGQTEAFDVSGEFFPCIDDPYSHPNLTWLMYPMLKLPTILSPTNRDYEGSQSIHSTGASGDDVGCWEKSELVKNSQLGRSLWCLVHVKYTDVYGQKWLLSFKRKWHTLQSGIDGYWYTDDFSEPEEKPVETFDEGEEPE